MVTGVAGGHFVSVQVPGLSCEGPWGGRFMKDLGDWDMARLSIGIFRVSAVDQRNCRHRRGPL